MSEWEDVETVEAEASSSDGWEDVADSSSEKWNLIDSAKQFGAGSVRGTTGLLGLLSDLNPLQFGGPKLDFPASNYLRSTVDEYLPEQEDQYRYAETLGEFAGPGGALGGLAKLAKLGGVAATPFIEALASQAAPKALVSAGSGALAAQAAEDVTGDQAVAPMVASIFGAAAPSVLSNLAQSGWRALRGATPSQIRGSAALALKESTNLTPEVVEAAIATAPRDRLGALMTTAELTDDAGIAQIEKTLGSEAGLKSEIYKNLQARRAGTRDSVLNRLSTTKAIDRESLGTKLIERAGQTKAEVKDAASALWEQFPRNIDIDVTTGQSEIGAILSQKQAGSPISASVENLVNQFLTPEGSLTTGALQDIRSDTLKLMRNRELTSYDAALLKTLGKETNRVVEEGLKSRGLADDYKIWTDARKLTAQEKDLFGKRSTGGILTKEDARPASVVTDVLKKGDTKAIKDLKLSLGQDARVLEDYKRGVLDLIPRDVQGKLTPNGLKKFIASKPGALKELYGEKGLGAMTRVLDDLKSEAKVGSELAFGSSKGGSWTAQRETVAGAVHDMMVSAVVPGVGPLAGLVDTIKRTADIKDAEAVKELLFKAALEPEFALELAMTPTTTRIYSALGRLKKMGKDFLTGGTRGALLEGATEQEESKKPAPKRAPYTKPSVFAVPEAEASVLPLSDTSPINDNLLDAIKQVESGGNVKAVSPKGAQGPYQFMPATAKAYGLKDPFDEVAARTAASSLLSDELESLGSLPLAIASYNAGRPKLLKAITKAGSTDWSDVSQYLPEETQNYVEKVFNLLS